MQMSTIDDNFYIQNTQTIEDSIAASLFSERAKLHIDQFLYDLELGPLPIKSSKPKTPKSKKYLRDRYYVAADVCENKNTPHKTMNTKLRLLVTEKCHNNCPMCCNKQFDLKGLPVVDRWDYDEIMITGGEPLASNKCASYLMDLVLGIRATWKACGWNGKIYLYTSTRRADLLTKVIEYFDGIVYTPHNIGELRAFVQGVCSIRFRGKIWGQSLRLNLFNDMATGYGSLSVSDRNIIERNWQIKNMEWVPNCPLPEGEDFRRIKFLL